MYFQKTEEKAINKNTQQKILAIVCAIFMMVAMFALGAFRFNGNKMTWEDHAENVASGMVFTK